MFDEKTLLIAHMAAVRARLLRDMIGIEELPLSSGWIYGDWTAANLLAHLGEYDNCHAHMVRDALAGRIAETGVDYTDIRDHLLKERVGTWSLEQSVDYFMKARTHFVDALREVPTDQLKKKHRFSWKFGDKTGRSQGTISTWAQWRYTHDVGHMDDLRQWYKRLPKTEAIGSQIILLAALEAARDDFYASAELVPIKERETRPVCGHWTLKDVLGHLADWDAFYLNTFYVMIGEPTTDLGWQDEDDSDALNEKLVKARANQSFEQVWQESQSARSNLLTELRLISDEMLGDPYGGDDSPYPTPYHCFWSALEHYLDHAAVIRRELKVPFPKNLLTFKGPYTD
jgi:DinB superfamily